MQLAGLQAAGGMSRPAQPLRQRPLWESRENAQAGRDRGQPRWLPSAKKRLCLRLEASLSRARGSSWAVKHTRWMGSHLWNLQSITPRSCGLFFLFCRFMRRVDRDREPVCNGCRGWNSVDTFGDRLVNFHKADLRSSVNKCVRGSWGIREPGRYLAERHVMKRDGSLTDSLKANKFIQSKNRSLQPSQTKQASSGKRPNAFRLGIWSSQLMEAPLGSSGGRIPLDLLRSRRNKFRRLLQYWIEVRNTSTERAFL